MTQGIVTEKDEDLVSVLVRGPNGQEDVEAVVDTGFTGYLTLPFATVSSLGLPFVYEIDAVLANGENGRFPAFRALLRSGGSWRNIYVMVTGRRPLLGTDFLHGHRLAIEFLDGGDVSIEPLE